MLDYFGLNEDSKQVVGVNGENDEEDQPGDEEELQGREATEFRGVAARVNYLSLDCPDLQFPVKQCSREMAKPTKGSWRRLKKVARYMLGVKSVKWFMSGRMNLHTAMSGRIVTGGEILRIGNPPLVGFGCWASIALRPGVRPRVLMR